MYVDDSDRATRIGESFGTKVIFVFQPLLTFKPHQATAEQAYLEPAIIAHANNCRQRMLSGLATLAEKKQILFKDASRLFDTITDAVYTDEIHIKQEYQPLVADILYDEANKVAGMP